jgi:hypothetical protein
MSRSEPTRTWQAQQHHRILSRDPIAFAQLCERAFEHLVLFLKSQFPGAEDHLPEMVVIDCLMNYYAKPVQFNPEKLSLFAYLRMASRGDMLNALDKNQRREKRLFNINSPEIRDQLLKQDGLREESELDDWLKEHTTLTRREILQALAKKLDKADMQVLLLSLDGVRESARYAEVMGITHLPLAEQRQTVKRTKDRIYKTLRRFGAQVSET